MSVPPPARTPHGPAGDSPPEPSGERLGEWPAERPVERAPAHAPGLRADGTFRVHARRKVSLRALVTHVERGWQQHAPVEDIGLGGARIVVDAPYRRGDAVTLSFTAPSLWDPLVLRARVAWVASVEPPRAGKAVTAGVVFDHRGAAAAFALYELIATLAYE
jgi:hypothetical protein